MNRSSIDEHFTLVDPSHARHPLCIGFDPDITELHPFLRRQLESTPLESFLVRWYHAVVEYIATPGTSIKLQSAFFEQFGPSGMSALQDIMLDAKRRKLYVILDAKRGDISSTMEAYGRAAFEHYQADALTILPWMGTDSLKALIPWLKNGRRVYIVWISSNQTGQQIQLLPAPLKKTPVALFVRDEFTKLAKKEKILDQIGWVLGATTLNKKILGQLPKKSQKLLLPGIGAQGAHFSETTNLLLKSHPESLFPVSRALLRPLSEAAISHWNDYSKIVENNWKRLFADYSKNLD
jgi:orotidine 5'-phosphate decarboxylase subfamily 2